MTISIMLTTIIVQAHNFSILNSTTEEILITNVNYLQIHELARIVANISTMTIASLHQSSLYIDIRFVSTVALVRHRIT